MMRLNQITKNYDNLLVLDDVNLRIDEKDFIIIEGESGSGKSTLLKLMGGLMKPDNGKILYQGNNIFNQSQDEIALWHRKNMGYVFQNIELIEYLNALDNIMVPMTYLNISLNKKKKRAFELLRFVGLEKWQNNYPYELSGGQAQRVAIARALANGPKMILCDEPTGALDPKSSKMIIELLKKMNQYGKTIIMVTHNSNFESYGNRIWKLKNGKVEEE